MSADEAQLTRNPLEGLAERLDFLGLMAAGVEERFGDLSADVGVGAGVGLGVGLEMKLDLLSFFLSNRIGGGENFSSRRFSRSLCFSSF